MAFDPPKYYPYDTTTGWSVFPGTPDTLVAYGNIHLLWKVNKSARSYYDSKHIICLSADSGQTWHEGERFQELFQKAFPGKNYYISAERDEALAPILKEREAWKRQRAKERKKVLDSAPPEEKASRLKKLADVKEAKRLREEELTAKRAGAAIDHMIKLGPELIKLKDKIEHIVELMGKGGIDRPIVQHDSKLCKIKSANYLLSQFEKHFIECHKRTGKL